MFLPSLSQNSMFNSSQFHALDRRANYCGSDAVCGFHPSSAPSNRSLLSVWNSCMKTHGISWDLQTAQSTRMVPLWGPCMNAQRIAKDNQLPCGVTQSLTPVTPVPRHIHLRPRLMQVTNVSQCRTSACQKASRPSRYSRRYAPRLKSFQSLSHHGQTRSRSK